MSRNLIVAQSGGPSAVINATLAGIVDAAMKSGKIGKVYGGFHGIQGMLRGEIIDIGAQIRGPQDLDHLALTPAMALRSCRFMLPDLAKDESPYAKLLNYFRQLNIGYFVYIGGNDSMDTAKKLQDYFHSKGEHILAMGCPKTIDNDLPITDHTPGFGSALKYVATTITEIIRDMVCMPAKSVFVLEVMGRDAGWLTAGTAIAQLNGGAPHLIYPPEIPFDPEQCVAQVKKLQETVPQVVIAVSEGIRGKDGQYVHIDAPGTKVDAFGHAQLGGAGRYVEHILSKELTCRIRTVELSLLQRVAGHCAAAVDVDEARRLGSEAVDLMATKGMTGKMVCLERYLAEPGAGAGAGAAGSCGAVCRYATRIITADLSAVAGQVRSLPKEWVKPDHTGLTDDGMAYFLPLVQGQVAPPMKNGLPDHFVFQPVFVALEK